MSQTRDNFSKNRTESKIKGIPRNENFTALFKFTKSVKQNAGYVYWSDGFYFYRVDINRDTLLSMFNRIGANKVGRHCTDFVWLEIRH